MKVSKNLKISTKELSHSPLKSGGKSGQLSSMRKMSKTIKPSIQGQSGLIIRSELSNYEQIHSDMSSEERKRVEVKNDEKNQNRYLKAQ